MPIDPTKLLAQSEVRLFGWLVGQAAEQTYVVEASEGASGLAESVAFSPNEVQEAIIPGPVLAAFQDSDTWLANVYAFSHEGRYTQFRAPALFLVPNQGEPVWLNDAVEPARLGLAQLDSNVKFASDLRFWTYDRSAHTIRLDMSAGTLQRLVIDLETGGAHGRRIDLVGQEGSFTARLGQGNH